MNNAFDVYKRVTSIKVDDITKEVVIKIVAIKKVHSGLTAKR
jgi:hypothetical protein